MVGECEDGESVGGWWKSVRMVGVCEDGGQIV